jgi:hypothetical protein
MRRALLVVAAALAGCSSGWVPLPRQEPPVDAPEPPDHRFFLHMASPGATRYVVQDIHNAPGLFRWTGPTPTVRLALPDPGPWLARIEFALPEPTFRQTGPVTVRLQVNGRLLVERRYEKPGEYSLEQQTPPQMLAGGGEAALQAEISPVYRAERDGAQLGCLLKAIGFLRP